jgi:hypothetical protein
VIHSGHRAAVVQFSYAGRSVDRAARDNAFETQYLWNETWRSVLQSKRCGGEWNWSRGAGQH